MKIALISNGSGGLYTFRKDLILRIKDNGNDVLAITPFGNRINQLRELNIKLIETKIDRRGINPIHDFLLWCKYIKILKKEKPDQVITYTIKPNIYGGLASRLFGISYAVNITGLGTAFESQGIINKIVIFLYRISLKKAKCVFFENSEILKLFIEKGIIRKDQAVLLNGAGVNLDYFAYKPYPKDDSFRFLFMGRVMKEKGIEELFSAMHRLWTEGEKCTLDLLGSFEEKYENQIDKFEKEGWLRYHGYQADVRPFIENAHCSVLPSYHEGMSNTNLESAAMGRPLITSNIPGCKEAVIPEISGYLCEPRNADSLYSVMKKMIIITVDGRAVMGKAGRKHMEDAFDKNKIVEKTIKYLF